MQDLRSARQQRPSTTRGSFASSRAFQPLRPEASADLVESSLRADAGLLKSRFRAFSESRTLIMPVERRGRTTVDPDGERRHRRREQGGPEVPPSASDSRSCGEGSHGKVLMRVPGDTDDGVAHAAEAALALHKRSSAHGEAAPNFVRVVQRPRMAEAARRRSQWGLANPGDPGLIGADVHARRRGRSRRGARTFGSRSSTRVSTPSTPTCGLRSSPSSMRSDGNPTSTPDGDDAHGTACAGIVGSRNSRVSGLAPGVSLVGGARIAKSNTQGFWVFDDFATADAIDWCWDDAQADVLSNSWGGGPPGPPDQLRLRAGAHPGPQRPRLGDRHGRGQRRQVVGELPGQPPEHADRRRLQPVGQAQDHHVPGRGDLVGVELGARASTLMAPGVAHQDDRHPRTRGLLDHGRTTSRFNGTSSATPFVAATAALMLSVKPDLTEERVRELIAATGIRSDRPARRASPRVMVGSTRAAVRAARRA